MRQDPSQQKIAKLESVNDQLQTELNFLNHLLKTVGFENGTETLKEAAIELLAKKKEAEDSDN